MPQRGPLLPIKPCKAAPSSHRKKARLPHPSWSRIFGKIQREKNGTHVHCLPNKSGSQFRENFRNWNDENGQPFFAMIQALGVIANGIKREICMYPIRVRRGIRM